MRQTGIEAVGSVPWGTHFCQFYENKQDLIEILVPFFKAGLESNEACLWIASEPLPAREAAAALAERAGSLDDYIRNGQLVIADYESWYASAGGFEAGSVIQGWIDRLAQARERGFEGLRLSGNAHGLKEPEWAAFMRYEQEFDSLVESRPMLALCSYNVAHRSAADLVETAGKHVFALAKRAGQWKTFEGAERAALREQREWLRVTLSSIGDAVLAADQHGRLAFMNAPATALSGWPESEALGRPIQDVFRIINENTRRPAEDIVGRVLREGHVINLANHTSLLSRCGREIPIEDSAAPIWDREGNVAGVVVVFHDVTEKRRAQRKLRESEERVRLKLESILSPQGNIGTLELRDIVDASAIQSLMEDLFKLTRIPMSIVDLHGREVAGVGWQPICRQFHNIHPETHQNCLESDTQLSSGVPAGEFRLYRCKNHMWDIATPLVVGGQHVGNVFSGQFFFDDETVDRELFRRQAQRYGFDEEAYLAALDAVPRLGREAVDTGMAFLTKLAHLLSLLSFGNIKLARALAEGERLTASLAQSRNALSRAQEIAHLGNWELDRGTGSFVCSDEAFRIFGFQPQEFNPTYQDYLDRVYPEDRAEVDRVLNGTLQEGKLTYETSYRIVRPSGEVRWVHVKGEHLRDDDGQVTHSFGMIEDVTERRQAEEAILQAQKMESIGLLAGGIAHDFNNLLVGVIGNACLAQDMLPEGGPASQALRRVIQSGEQAAHLTRQMLAYAGKGRFLIKPVRLTEVVGESLDLIRSSVSKKIDFELRLDADLPVVESDPSQMQQVFMNLAQNAAESIGGGAGTISISTGAAHLDAARVHELESWGIAPGWYVFLEVHDTGPGMSEAVRTRIFDPFFTTKFQGRGLGLAAVAGIVRAHRGAIEVVTAPGAGALFRVFLPAAGAKPEPAAPAKTAAEDLRSSGTVLVVDDEETVRDLARRVLDREGYRVLMADGGPAALELLRLAADLIDLAVLDLGMPGMSGEEALARLRDLKPELRVIVSSGYSEAETQRIFHGARLSGFLQKPYTPRDLAREVKRALAGAAE